MAVLTTFIKRFLIPGNKSDGKGWEVSKLLEGEGYQEEFFAGDRCIRESGCDDTQWNGR